MQTKTELKYVDNSYLPKTGDIVDDDPLRVVVAVQSVYIIMLGLQEFGNVQDDRDKKCGKNVGKDPHSGAVGDLQRPIQNWPDTKR